MTNLISVNKLKQCGLCFMKTARFDDLKKLYLVRTLVEQNNLNRTAKIHRVTSSAVSQSIRTLEVSLGYPVVMRTTNGWRPTEKGSEVLSKAEKIFALMSSSFELENADVFTIKSLAIGAYESFAAEAFRILGQRLREDFPAIKLSFLVARSGELVKKILSGEICTALMAENDALTQDLITKELYTDTMGLFSSRKIPFETLANDAKIVFAQLAPGFEGHSLYMKKYIDQFEFIAHPMICDSLEVLRELAESGEVVAILPTRVARKAKSQLYQIGREAQKSDGRHRILIAASKSCDVRELDYLHKILIESEFFSASP